MRTFLSLFSGAGGLDLGFAQAGYQPIWVNERCPSAATTHQQLLSKHASSIPHMFVGDIQDALDQRQLPQPTRLDLVIGGPPCQGFSVAGKQDPRSELVHRFFDIIEHTRPRGYVMENVAALATSQRWQPTLVELQRRSHKLGYRTTLWVLDAADHGVPQHRKRMFLIGTPGDTAVPTPPTAQPPISVRKAFTQLPQWGTPGNDTYCAARITPARNPVLRPSPYAGMLFNGAGRPINLDQPAPAVTASFGGNRTHIVDQLLLDDPSSPNWLHDYHRRLMSGAPPTTSVPPHLRRLTVEEASVLQGFPTDTTWHGPTSNQFRQIGNAVPPPLAHAIATALRRALP